MAEGGTNTASLIRISEKSKRCLTKNWVYLITNVKADSCLRLLKAGGAITTNKYDEIVQLHSREAKVETILGHLSRGTQGLYSTFIHALSDSEQTAVVARLQERDTTSVTAIADLLIQTSKAFHPEFIEHLRFEGSLLTHLEGAGAITGSERETLKAILTRGERAEALLSMLEKGEDEKRNNGFIQALAATDQPHLALLIQNGDRSGLVPREKRDLLRKEKPQLIQHITRQSGGSMSGLLSYLVAQALITSSQRDVILARRTLDEQADELLDVLVCRPYRPGYGKRVQDAMKTGLDFQISNEGAPSLLESTTGTGDIRAPSLTENYIAGLKSSIKRTSEEKNKKLNETLGIVLDRVLYCDLAMADHLADIEMDSTEETEKYIRRTAESLQTRKTVPIDHLFKPQEEIPEPSRVLLLGGAGMGKSTITQEYGRRWSDGEIKATKIIAYYAFECRRFTYDIDKGNTISLLDLLLTRHGPGNVADKDKAILLQFILEHESEIVLAIDGLDELSAWTSCGDNTPEMYDLNQPGEFHHIMYNLIHQRLLPKAKILVTSRPIASVKQQDFKRSLVALGFSTNSIKECIRVLSDTEELAQKVTDYIYETNLVVYCIVPLTCVLLVVILCHDLSLRPGLRLPSLEIDSMTRLYIRSVLEFLWRRKPFPESLLDLTPEQGESLLKLARLAARGMLGEETVIIFDQSDLRANDISPQANLFGLLEVSRPDRPRRGYEIPYTASFLHLSFQEFLAAIHLALTWDTAQVEVLHQESHQRLDMVRMFLSGLLGDCEGQRFLRAIDPELSADTSRGRVLALLTRDGRKQSGEDGTLVALNVVQCVAEGKLAELVPVLEGALLKVEEDNNSSAKKEWDFEDEEKEVEGQNAKTLNMSSCPGGLLPHHLSSIRYFVQASTTNCLILMDNKIGYQGALRIAKALENSTSLRVLDLSNNEIGFHGAQYLAKALDNNITLRVLWLGKNGIGHQGAQQLAKALETNTTLMELRLERNQIGDTGAQHLAWALETNTTLMELRLLHNSIEDQGALYLGRALERNTTLRDLGLSGNHIGDQGALHLGRALQENTSLRVLKLSGSIIGDQGAYHLERGLKKNTTLRVLELEINQIGNQGAQSLRQALEMSNSLRELKLGTNLIGDQGAVHLGRGLEGQTSLRELCLFDNKIGDAGAAHLARALAVNTALQTLGLGSNPIHDEGAKLLAEALRNNQTFKKLRLSTKASRTKEIYLADETVKLLSNELGERIQII